MDHAKNSMYYYDEDLGDTIEQRVGKMGRDWPWLRDKIAARSTPDVLAVFDVIGTPRERQISYGLSIDLSNILGGRPEYWFTVQSAYDFFMNITAGHYDPDEDCDPEEDFDDDGDDDE